MSDSTPFQSTPPDGGGADQQQYEQYDANGVWYPTIGNGFPGWHSAGGAGFLAGPPFPGGPPGIIHRDGHFTDGMTQQHAPVWGASPYPQVMTPFWNRGDGIPPHFSLNSAAQSSINTGYPGNVHIVLNIIDR